MPVEDLLTLEAALARLETIDARAGQVVTLRFYSGMSNLKIAEHLGLSLKTVEAIGRLHGHGSSANWRANRKNATSDV